jgi:deoxyxylulose-5-phosphate synthase
MLLGGHSCGKSTTLNEVYGMLMSNHAISTNKQPLGGNKKDFSDIVLYKNKKVAIFTMGDCSRDVVKAMKDYSNQGIDDLVCACNDRFVRPLNQINKYANSVIIRKTVAATAIAQPAANSTDANQIFSLI